MFLDLIGPGRFIDPAVIHASAARGDDWYPYAAKMPLNPEATSQPTVDMTTFILHSMAGPELTSLEALWTYMSRTDVTGECTWILDFPGRCAQTVPVSTRADNNYKANPFATSVETQDRGYRADPGIAVTPWSDPQLAQLAGLSAWQVLHPRLHIPLRRADQGWNGGGIDGHRRYAEWSKYIGKTCPGQARWEQIDSILDAARRIVEWSPAPPAPAPDPGPVPMPPASPPPLDTEDDMTPTPWLIAKTTDGPHLAAKSIRTGGLHVSNDVPVEYVFAAGDGVAFDLGSRRLVTLADWPAVKAVLTKAQALAYMGAEI